MRRRHGCYFITPQTHADAVSFCTTACNASRVLAYSRVDRYIPEVVGGALSFFFASHPATISSGAPASDSLCVGKSVLQPAAVFMWLYAARRSTCTMHIHTGRNRVTIHCTVIGLYSIQRRRPVSHGIVILL